MNWNQYITELLKAQSPLDEVSFTFESLHTTFSLPPLLKASVSLLDTLLCSGSQRNVLVFPDHSQLCFLFALARTLHNVAMGRIASDYDPASFQEGDRLQVGKAIVKFQEIFRDNGVSWIRLAMKNGQTTTPLDSAPVLQRVVTQLPLSTLEKYNQELQELQPVETSPLCSTSNILARLAECQTHMAASLVYVTTLGQAEHMVSDTLLADQHLTQFLLIGKVGLNGELKYTFAGQKHGIPALVLAPDLYSVKALAESGHPIQSILVDGTHESLLNTQLDCLDSLLLRNVPLTWLTDTARSFHMEPLEERDFQIWRWSQENLAPPLRERNVLSSDIRIRNCHSGVMETRICQADGLEQAVKALRDHRGEVPDMTEKAQALYVRLYGLSCNLLYELALLDSDAQDRQREALDAILAGLEAERYFITEETFQDLTAAASSLRECVGTLNDKRVKLANLLQRDDWKFLYLVIQERTDRDAVQAYLSKALPADRFRVVYPSEYCTAPALKDALTVVTGWFGRSPMRQILCSFNTTRCILLLYACEDAWRNSAIRSMEWHLSQESTRIRPSFFLGEEEGQRPLAPTPAPLEENTEGGEFQEIESTVRMTRYRKYKAEGNKGALVKAVPVSFAGGWLAFYPLSHSVLKVTDIILGDGEKPQAVLPEALTTEDFIVERESDSGLIREVADAILERSGHGDARRLAGKWRESLTIAVKFSSLAEQYKNMQRAGYTKTYDTFANWMTDQEMIGPQTKEDLACLAKATQSGVLMKLLDEIYDAIVTVRSAHSQAGTKLGKRLRDRLGEVIQQYGDLDPWSLWEPIEMQVEGVGTARILKVIDLGEPIYVKESDTNQLIREE